MKELPSNTPIRDRMNEIGEMITLVKYGQLETITPEERVQLVKVLEAELESLSSYYVDGGRDVELGS